MDENEAKENAREKKGNMLDSFTIGTAAKEGAFKVYFDIEEEIKKKPDESKAYKLLQLRKSLDTL